MILCFDILSSKVIKKYQIVMRGIRFKKSQLVLLHSCLWFVNIILSVQRTDNCSLVNVLVFNGLVGESSSFW